MSELLNELSAHPLFTQLLGFAGSLLAIFLLVQFVQSLAARNISDKNLRFRTRKAFSIVGYALGFVCGACPFQ